LVPFGSARFTTFLAPLGSLFSPLHLDDVTLLSTNLAVLVEVLSTLVGALTVGKSVMSSSSSSWRFLSYRVFDLCDESDATLLYLLINTTGARFGGAASSHLRRGDLSAETLWTEQYGGSWCARLPGSATLVFDPSGALV